MNVLVEITLYPLQDDFLAPIDDFLASLNAQSAVEVKTRRMSTQLYGEYDAVMDLLRDAIKASQARHGSGAFVLKLIPGAARTIKGYQ